MPQIQKPQYWLLVYLTRDILFSYEADFIEEKKVRVCYQGMHQKLKAQTALRAIKVIHEVSGAEGSKWGRGKTFSKGEKLVRQQNQKNSW